GNATERYRFAHSRNWTSLDTGERTLLGPLSLYSGTVILVVDGLDQLELSSRTGVLELITQLTTRKDLSNVSVICTTRDAALLPGHAHAIDIWPVNAATARQYLERQLGAGDHLDALVREASGNWLVLKTLAAAQTIGTRRLAESNMRGDPHERLYAAFIDAAR